MSDFTQILMERYLLLQELSDSAGDVNIPKRDRKKSTKGLSLDETRNRLSVDRVDSESDEHCADEDGFDDNLINSNAPILAKCSDSGI